jgi:hypothetical protein
MDESPDALRQEARRWAALSHKTQFARLRRDYADKALWFALLAEHRQREEQRLAAAGARPTEIVSAGEKRAATGE